MKITAGVIILNKNGNVLILKPSGKVNVWSIPKGEVDKDESPEEAAVREVLEETGFEIDPSFLIYLGSSIYKSKKKKIEVFVYESDMDDYEPSLDWENEAYKWVRASDAYDMVHEAQKEFMHKMYYWRNK